VQLGRNVFQFQLQMVVIFNHVWSLSRQTPTLTAWRLFLWPWCDWLRPFAWCWSSYLGNVPMHWNVRFICLNDVVALWNAYAVLSSRRFLQLSLYFVICCYIKLPEWATFRCFQLAAKNSTQQLANIQQVCCCITLENLKTRNFAFSCM